jgi:hypothetical protein
MKFMMQMSTFMCAYIPVTQYVPLLSLVLSEAAAVSLELNSSCCRSFFSISFFLILWLLLITET